MNLRNPWGKVDWTGDWSPQSEKWTEEIKRELGITDD
jgi:calpain-15